MSWGVEAGAPEESLLQRFPAEAQPTDPTWAGQPVATLELYPMALGAASGRYARRVERFRERLLRRLPPLPDRFGLPAGTVFAIAGRDHVVYRVLGRSQPRDWDFKSNRDKSRPRAPQEDFIDYVAVSVFGSEEAAVSNATKFPKLVAEVSLSEGRGGFSIARTLADVDGHYSIWGDPEELVACVRGVSRTDEPG